MRIFMRIKYRIKRFIKKKKTFVNHFKKMVDFRFDIRPLFKESIVKVTSNLLPHTFQGDRRQCLDATSKMSEIIDCLGQLSAQAQKLNKPVTTAQRLRMSENQVIYLMANTTEGKNGKVLGLLKVGTKDLYLFDETGQTRKVAKAPSILDFYIHESRQRSGLGKELFETMLANEGWTPIKCSIDRPSEKLLAFLKKHYGLERVIPQANNFVLYEGFFDTINTDNNKNIDKLQQQNQKATNGSMMHITNSPNTQLFGATYLGNDDNHNKKRHSRHLDTPTNNIAAQMAQIAQIAPAGRYGARRPSCSMAEIIHNGPPTTKNGTTTSGRFHAVGTSKPTINYKNDLAALNSLNENFQNVSINGLEGEEEAVEIEEENEVFERQYQKDENIENSHYECNNVAADEMSIQHTIDGSSQFEHDAGFIVNNEAVKQNLVRLDDTIQSLAPGQQTLWATGPGDIGVHDGRSSKSPTIIKPAPTFQLSKQHTGMKNRSDGVGMAVTPTNKMEFEQENLEEFGVSKIHRRIGHKKTLPSSAIASANSDLLPNHNHNEDNDDATSTVSSKEESAFTQQGYHDMKFFHNKLW